MSKKIIWIMVGIFVVVGAGALFQTVPGVSEVKTVQMINNKGEDMGTIKLSQTKAGVLFNLDLHGLPPNGEHAIHVHETGSCLPLESFKDAGGHFNPTQKMHGMKHPEGHHAGDMPNLVPDAKGNLQTTFMNMNITLGKSTDKLSSVYDDDGSAIVIHADADDHMSQPSGAAGDRMACGVIQ